MIYKPKTIEKMWDTWMFHHDDVFYLYYLVTNQSPGEGICLATSTDGVHWTELGLIFPKAEDCQWLGTGSVWKSSTFDHDGKFIMNFSEWRGASMHEGQQTIFFAESTDLIHWTRLPDRYEFAPDTRWYRINENSASRWDCIYTIPRPDGGRYGYWTGNPIAFHPGFGYGETLDGVRWEALPPPHIEWGTTLPMVNLEVGAIEKFGDSYYAMLGSYSEYHHHSMGMFAFTADSFVGPFHPARKNYELLTSAPEIRSSYFSRFFPFADDILVNHQVMTRSNERYFAPLKRAVVDDEGILRLRYWHGNDVLKGSSLAIAEPFEMTLDAETGVIIEGQLIGLPTTVEPATPALSFHITSNENRVTVIRIYSAGVVEFGNAAADGSDFQLEDRVDREINPVSECQVRFLIRHSLLELYLDEMLIQCFSLPEVALRQLLLISGTANLTDVSAFRMVLEMQSEG